MLPEERDLEWEYNNRKRVPEHTDITSRWEREAATYRTEANAEFDIPYGRSERMRFDLFMPTNNADNAPLTVFIHGGYWYSRDRKDFSHFAKCLNEQGIRVAMPSYDLCPGVTIKKIIEQIRLFMCELWRITDCRPVVVGHSAGGHLAAAMVATDWSYHQRGVPEDLVRVGYAISGIFDLTPLTHTTINAQLGLTLGSAQDASPLFWTFPAKGKTLITAHGDQESEEFAQQSLNITQEWENHGVSTNCVTIKNTNHFTILEELANPMSSMVAHIVDLTRGK